jgi:hypothetical protein
MVSRRVSGGGTLAEAGGQPDCGHVRQATGEVLEVPTGLIQGWMRGSTSDSGAEACFPPGIGSTDEGGGGWVSGYR